MTATVAKYAIIVQTGENDGARAVHGLLYARELKEGGTDRLRQGRAPLRRPAVGA